MRPLAGKHAVALIVPRQKRGRDLVSMVQYGGEGVVVAHFGGPVAALVSLEGLEVLERLEDQGLVELADQSESESGPDIPWEEVKAEAESLPWPTPPPGRGTHGTQGLRTAIRGHHAHLLLTALADSRQTPFPRWLRKASVIRLPGVLLAAYFFPRRCPCEP